MKKFITLIVFILCSLSLSAQFDIEAYKEYLKTHKDMSVDDLLKEYPAGKFLSEAPTDFMKSEFADSISLKFALTDYEKSLINKHGFMVSERLNYYTFMQALWDVYNKDMPVYISSDAILHALHYSFDNILISFEDQILSKKLISALSKMKINLKSLSAGNVSEIYTKSVNDLDVYLTVTEKLLNIYSTCVFPENEVEVQKLMTLINGKQIADYPLFAEKTRLLDFSQFTPRGHYTRIKELTNYFLAMTWLGRTEIILTNPKNEGSGDYSNDDLQRMAILAALISEVADNSGAVDDLKAIDEILTFLLGRQDNVNVWEISDALKSLSLNAKDIAVEEKWQLFRDKVLELNSANQLYYSQILFSDPLNPEQIVPPAVFLMMGQRPILDGFITANVVYDRIMFEGNKVIRLIPSTMDILFSLGNDAGIQLLIDELEKYPYSTNLAALRYLLDSYDNDFWKSNTYTCWLNGIRSLNPPDNRNNLPKFMQTAAWWQKTMSTQLASWAELRHDFLLYAKQPYTGGLGCSYPYGYVEPVPQLYDNIKQFFVSLRNLVATDYLKDEKYFPGNINEFANRWLGVCDTLKSMSEKILIGKEFSKEENNFISSTLRTGGKGCFLGIEGWYPEIYYEFGPSAEYMTDMERRGNTADDFIVADVHTIPTDEYGNMVGWVLHAGTGRINMAVITTQTPDGGNRSYIGPVSSYYEFISNDFKRLTDEEWREMDGAPAYRPAFTNLYLADKNGNNPAGDKVSLFTTSVFEPYIEPAISDILNMKCYPNPFKNSTVISFTLSNELAEQKIELKIYDMAGNLIKSLVNQKLYPNNYAIVWDGMDNQGNKVSTGNYIYSIKIGEYLQSGKVNLVR